MKINISKSITELCYLWAWASLPPAFPRHSVSSEALRVSASVKRVETRPKLGRKQAKRGPKGGQKVAKASYVFSYKQALSTSSMGKNNCQSVLRIHAPKTLFTQGKDPKDNRSRRVQIHFDLSHFHTESGGLGSAVN